MQVSEFLDTLDSAPPAPVYLFCPFKAPRQKNASFEPLLARQAVDRLVERYVDPGMKDLCYSMYHADEADPGEIVSVAETLPFLTERRVIVVRNAEHYASIKAAGALLPYLASVNETTMLILVTSQVDRRSKFYKACEKVAQIVGCPELSRPEAVSWVRDEAAKREKKIERGAAQALADRTGTRLGDLLNAVTLVCDYVGDTETVTEQDVTVACADVAEEEIWALTDAISDSNTKRAVRALRDILELGKSEFELLGTINWLLKSAYGVASGSRNVNPYVASKAAPLAKKLGKQKLRKAFGLCMQAEIQFRTTGVDRSLALELLVIKLAAPRRRRSA